MKIKLSAFKSTFGKGPGVIYLYCIIRHKDSQDVIHMNTPEKIPGDGWTIIPIIELEPIPSVYTGPSFSVKLRWLRWEMTLLQWTRDPIQEYDPEEVTAESNHQDTYVTERSPHQQPSTAL